MTRPLLTEQRILEAARQLFPNDVIENVAQLRTIVDERAFIENLPLQEKDSAPHQDGEEVASSS